MWTVLASETCGHHNSRVMQMILAFKATVSKLITPVFFGEGHFKRDLVWSTWVLRSESASHVKPSPSRDVPGTGASSSGLPAMSLDVAWLNGWIGKVSLEPSTKKKEGRTAILVESELSELNHPFYKTFLLKEFWKRVILNQKVVGHVTWCRARPINGHCNTCVGFGSMDWVYPLEAYYTVYLCDSFQCWKLTLRLMDWKWNRPTVYPQVAQLVALPHMSLEKSGY